MSLGTEFTDCLGVRAMLDRIGPVNLSQGVNENHPISDMIVDVHADSNEALARGLGIAIWADAKTRSASWEFNIFSNRAYQGE